MHDGFWRLLFFVLIVLSAPLTMFWTAVGLTHFPGHEFLVVVCSAITIAYLVGLVLDFYHVWYDDAFIASHRH